MKNLGLNLVGKSRVAATQQQHIPAAGNPPEAPLSREDAQRLRDARRNLEKAQRGNAGNAMIELQKAFQLLHKSGTNFHHSEVQSLLVDLMTTCTQWTAQCMESDTGISPGEFLALVGENSDIPIPDDERLGDALNRLISRCLDDASGVAMRCARLGFKEPGRRFDSSLKAALFIHERVGGPLKLAIETHLARFITAAAHPAGAIGAGCAFLQEKCELALRSIGDQQLSATLRLELAACSALREWSSFCRKQSSSAAFVRTCMRRRPTWPSAWSPLHLSSPGPGMAMRS